MLQGNEHENLNKLFTKVMLHVDLLLNSFTECVPNL